MHPKGLLEDPPNDLRPHGDRIFSLDFYGTLCGLSTGHQILIKDRLFFVVVPLNNPRR